MKRIGVESSSIAGAGYDAGEQILEIEFRNGLVYRYFGVAPAVYEGLMAAESKGRYMNAEIRSVYPYEQVRR
jgi:KTSC domain-containing protein